MSAVTATRDARLSDLPPASGRAGIVGALRSEYTKIRSVRSTYWTLLALVLICVGLGALIGWGTESHFNQLGPADRATFDATQNSLTALYLGQLVMAVLGALVITTEYSTGMIRTSLTAMPRRGTVFAAKALVFTVISLVVGEITSFVMFFLGQALLHSTGASATLSQPGVLRAVIGGGLFLAGCGLFSFAIGAILRHTAGAISAAVGILFVLPLVSNALPHSWQEYLDKFLPSSAGSAIWSVRRAAMMYSPWTEFFIFLAWIAVLLIAGMFLFRTRDA
jgi:ABC-type transport system involved in multi-copper enzyme maturation permease subunit